MPVRTKSSVVIDEFLRLMAFGSLGAAMVVAPNAVSLLEKPIAKISKRLNQPIEARKIAYYIRRTKLVEVEEQPDGSYEVSLTPKGKRRVQKLQFDTMTIARPKRWDGRWRLVVFDIPEEHKDARRFLVDKLKQLNFYMLQRSLWVHPFPCLEQVSVIKQVLPEVARHVVLLESDEIDEHNRLVKHFVALLPT